MACTYNGIFCFATVMGERRVHGKRLQPRGLVAHPPYILSTEYLVLERRAVVKARVRQVISPYGVPRKPGE